jgi:hypothetical protein
MELDSEDLKLDFWRKYSTPGGRLYYDMLSKEPEIVRINDVI